MDKTANYYVNGIASDEYWPASTAASKD